MSDFAEYKEFALNFVCEMNIVPRKLHYERLVMGLYWKTTINNRLIKYKIVLKNFLFTMRDHNDCYFYLFDKFHVKRFIVPETRQILFAYKKISTVLTNNL